jgi:hypothetical protein
MWMDNIVTPFSSRFPDVVISSMAKENEGGIDVIGVTFTSQSKKMDADVTPDGVTILVLIRQNGTWPSGDVAPLVKPNYFDNHTILTRE